MENAIIVNTKTPVKLGRLGANRILLKRIEVIPHTTDTKHLWLPIKVETIFPNGSLRSYLIHPMSYFDLHKPSARFAATNKEIDEVITYCKFSTLQLQTIHEEDKSAELKVTFRAGPEPIEVYVSETFDGFAFGLPPQSKKVVKEFYPEARIANSISVARGTLYDFQTQYGTIHGYLLSALTGLSDNKAEIFSYNLVDSSSGKIIYSSEKVK